MLSAFIQYTHKTNTMFGNFFKKLFSNNKGNKQKSDSQNLPEITPEMSYLIVGLGNIGEQYEDTRHNIGFDVVQHLADKHDARFESKRLAFYATFRSKGKAFHLIKPTTFMNLSGKAVKYWKDNLKIKQENILIVVDDLNLPFGKLRMRKKGKNAGHNGLKDIDAKLGGNNYARLKFGIDDNFSRGKQVEYVLGKWNKKEGLDLNEYIQKAGELALAFGTIGIDRAMSQGNKKKKAPKADKVDKPDKAKDKPQ